MPADTVLILGGKDKGNDYSEILPLVKEKVKAIICMGKDNAKLLDFFTGQVPEIHDTHSIDEAVATRCFSPPAAPASTSSAAMKTAAVSSRTASAISNQSNISHQFL